MTEPHYFKTSNFLDSVLYKDVELTDFFPKMHKHDELEITWIKDGSRKLFMDDEVHAFQTGDIFVIDRQCPHYFKLDHNYKVDPDQKVKVCSVYFDPNGNMAGLFRLPEMKGSVENVCLSNKSFKIAHESANFIKTKLSAMEGASGINLMMGFISLMTAVAKVEKQLLISHFKIEHELHRDDRIFPVLDHLNKYFYNRLSLEEAADMTHMTKNSFCRSFKQLTGRTYLSYVHERRIEEVCKSMLINGDKQLFLNLAYRVGFNSITNFNRVFKAIKGMSPTEYLEKYKSQRSDG